MAVHSSGDGAQWPEDLDADQPHGLDYRQFNHVTIGVRKRIGQEHTTFADSTVGGIHKPGGVAVLGMEITDTAVDPTDLVVPDGTYRGHGIVWAYDDASNSGTLWCATAAAGISETGDWTLMKLNPNDQWGGGDVTWAGEQHFDSSVDFDCTAVVFNGDVSIVQGLACGSDVEVAGDFSVDGTADFGDAVAILGGVSLGNYLEVDGTEDHNDEADFSAVNIDGTTSLIVACTSQSNGVVDMSSAVTYKVDTDGRVDGHGVTTAQDGIMRLYIGSADPPDKIISTFQQRGNSSLTHVSALVPQNWFWEISITNVTTNEIYWTAIGKGACVSQA